MEAKTDIIYLGYTCPACGRYNVVLSSIDPKPASPCDKVMKCCCGRVRLIHIAEIQSLEVLRLKAA